MDEKRLALAVGLPLALVASVGTGFLYAAGTAARSVPTAACEALGPRPLGKVVSAGALAPDFELPDASGARRSLAGARGRPVLVHFWATWCAPCVEEMPALERLARRLGDRVTVLAVSVDESWAPVKRFFPGGTNLTLLLDPEREIAGRFGATGYPESFLVDRRGRLQHLFHQARWDSPQATTCLETLP
jgi:thiol-disulfide isomerase/thioredoxin